MGKLPIIRSPKCRGCLDEFFQIDLASDRKDDSSFLQSDGQDLNAEIWNLIPPVKNTNRDRRTCC
jgi:hypothetical protein